MSANHADARTLARVLAAQFANEAPWTDRGEADSDDAIGQVSNALDPQLHADTEALLAELKPLSPDLARKVSDLIGRVMAHGEDGGYLFGLAVGQLIKIPALTTHKRRDGGR